MPMPNHAVPEFYAYLDFT